jgi:hypothetical protein
VRSRPGTHQAQSVRPDDPSVGGDGGLKNVGGSANTDNSIVTKGYVDTRQAALAVTPAYIARR